MHPLSPLPAGPREPAVPGTVILPLKNTYRTPALSEYAPRFSPKRKGLSQRSFIGESATFLSWAGNLVQQAAFLHRVRKDTA